MHASPDGYIGQLTLDSPLLCPNPNHRDHCDHYPPVEIPPKSLPQTQRARIWTRAPQGREARSLACLQYPVDSPPVVVMVVVVEEGEWERERGKEI